MRRIACEALFGRRVVTLPRPRRRSRVPSGVGASGRCLFAAALLLLVIGVAAGAPWVQAQEIWQPDNAIPDYADLRPPVLVADQDKTIHAFYDQAVGDGIERFLFYRTWTATQGWGPPVDILLSPVCCTFKVLGVHLDGAGIFHLVFFAGNPPDAGAIYYTTASAVHANSARAWSEPKLIADDAGPLATGALAVDAAGELVVLFAGRFDGIGLYEVRSSGGGVTWAPQRLLELPGSQDTSLVHPQLLRDSEGTLHAVWEVMNSRGLGDEVHYARQEAGQTAWTGSVLLGQRETEHAAGFGAAWPAIIEHQNELFVFYEDGTGSVGIPPAMWVRRSSDGGKSWSRAEQPFPQVGGYEQALLLEDSGGVLHAFFGGRVGDPIIGGLWHSQWQDGRWSEPQAVASSLGRSAEEQRRFGPSGPRGAISQGNKVVLTWWNDAPDKTPAHFSSATLDAPELAAAPVPTPAATSTPTPRPTPVAATPTTEGVALAPPPAALLSSAPLPGAAARPGSAIVWGSLLILAVNVLIIFVLRVRSRGAQR